MGRIHSARDVCAFHMTVIVWCGKLELAWEIRTNMFTVS
jgi:hypothetical protein